MTDLFPDEDPPLFPDESLDGRFKAFPGVVHIDDGATQATGILLDPRFYPDAAVQRTALACHDAYALVTQHQSGVSQYSEPLFFPIE